MIMINQAGIYRREECIYSSNACSIDRSFSRGYIFFGEVNQCRNLKLITKQWFQIAIVATVNLQTFIMQEMRPVWSKLQL